MVEVRAPRKGDVETLVANMRPQDVDEVEAVLGHCDLVEAVNKSLRDSAMAWTAEADGELMCIFGVVPLSTMGDVGVPWMLGTRVVDRNGRALTRLGATYIARMLAEFPVLANGVDARNVKAVRWIRRMGFKLQPAAPMGSARVPFYPFVLKA